MALDRKAPNAPLMPFTANWPFKKTPLMSVAAKNMHSTTSEGWQVLDGTAGPWCCTAGHCRPWIIQAIQKQAAKLDYAAAFQMGHPIAFKLANRIIAIAKMGLIGAVELEPTDRERTKRGFSAFLKACEKAILIPTTGYTIAMLPPLIISMAENDQLIGTLGDVLRTID